MPVTLTTGISLWPCTWRIHPDLSLPRLLFNKGKYGSIPSPLCLKQAILTSFSRIFLSVRFYVFNPNDFYLTRRNPRSFSRYFSVEIKSVLGIFALFVCLYWICLFTFWVCCFSFPDLFSLFTRSGFRCLKTLFCVSYIYIYIYFSAYSYIIMLSDFYNIFLSILSEQLFVPSS